MRRSILATLLVCVGWGIVGSVQAQGPLAGVWQVVEVVDEGGTNAKPEPGLYIFTKGHYSIVEIQSRTEMADVGDVIRSQSGKYEAANGRITFLAMVARNPKAMQTGVQGAYTVADGTLTITTGKVIRKFKRLE